MIAATRRQALMGALALPAAGLPQLARSRSLAPVMIHDPDLLAGKRFAQAALARGDTLLPIEGDRIRFARALFERGPTLVVGVSRHADAMLIGEVGREAGYVACPVPAALQALVPHRARGFGWALAPSGRLPQS